MWIPSEGYSLLVDLIMMGCGWFVSCLRSDFKGRFITGARPNPGFWSQGPPDRVKGVWGPQSSAASGLQLLTSRPGITHRLHATNPKVLNYIEQLSCVRS